MIEVLEAPPPGSREMDSSSPRSTRASSLLVYAATVFLSAALLFQVQLIFAKYILPLFGGVPAVWNTCMFCFQVLLLVGYGYAHWLQRCTVREQRAIHLTLLLASAALMVFLWLRWRSTLTP